MMTRVMMLNEKQNYNGPEAQAASSGQLEYMPATACGELTNSDM